MKKITLAALSLLLLCGGMTSCSNDDDDQVMPKPYLVEYTTNFNNALLSYLPDGVWKDYDKDGDLEIGPLEFSHDLSEWGTVNGFVASRSTETAFHDPMYLSPYCYQVATGKGVAGTGTSYLVAYWNSSEIGDEHSCEIEMDDETEFYPMEVKVNNTSYTYYTMLNGNDYSRKFEKGDYFRLVAHGVAANGTETTVSFDLANIQTDNVEEGIVTDWTPFNLRSLGLVAYLYFTLESNVADQYGLTVPTYFALGEITVGQVVTM